MKTRMKIPGKPSYGVCPLCEKAFPQSQLQAPLTSEPPASRRQIIKAIRAEHPAWTNRDGACQVCWESFRGVVRVLDFVKKFKAARLRHPERKDETP